MLRSQSIAVITILEALATVRRRAPTVLSAAIVAKAVNACGARIVDTTRPAGVGASRVV